MNTVEHIDRARGRGRRRSSAASAARRSCRDRGAVDVSVQMLFGMVLLLFVLLLVAETVTYWHARNVFGEAAAEGARVAAAHDGTCADGVAATRAMVERMAGGWSDGLIVKCMDGPMVAVRVVGRSPGIIGDQLGTFISVVESAPKER